MSSSFREKKGKTASHVHCSNFLCRKVKSSSEISSGNSPTSNELEMSTARPSCCPKRQPTTRAVSFWSGLFTLFLVWWSLMLINTSCKRVRSSMVLAIADSEVVCKARNRNWSITKKNLQGAMKTPARCWSSRSLLSQAPWCSKMF